MQDERDDDAARVFHQTDHIGLLDLESSDGEVLADDGDEDEGQHAVPEDINGHRHHKSMWEWREEIPPVVAAGRKAEEAGDGADEEHLWGGDDPGGEGERGPVDVPQVADDHVDAAARDVCQQEADGCVGHVVCVAGAGLTEYHGGLNHQEYPSEGQQQVQHLHRPAGFLQEEAGEEGHDSRLDGWDHHHVAYREISEMAGQLGGQLISVSPDGVEIPWEQNSHWETSYNADDDRAWTSRYLTRNISNWADQPRGKGVVWAWTLKGTV